MLDIDTPGDMDALVGTTLGIGEWMTIDQDRIDQFAQATGDHQWIHVDVARAAKEMPDGKTIAHGFLTLSLVPLLGRSIFQVKRRSRALNYGLNRVRFTSTVQVGARVRARQILKASESVEGGRRLIVETTVEIEGQGRPALVAETITVMFD